MLGCFAVTCKKPCISGTFCVFSFLIGTLALVTGAIVFGLDWDEIQTKTCNLSLDNYQGKTGTEYFRQQYGSMVDDFMCSDTCPCDRGM